MIEFIVFERESAKKLITNYCTGSDITACVLVRELKLNGFLSMLTH